jgi:hypothetical protein
MSNIETLVGFEHRRVISQQMFNQGEKAHTKEKRLIN